MSLSSASNSITSKSEIYPDHVELIKAKKKARKKSIDNRQFLIAISECDLEQVTNLLEKVDINFEDRDGCTPLHWAVETGDVKIIEILLKNGVDLCSKNIDNETPVDIAKKSNNLDIVNILKKWLRDTGKPNIIETKTISEWDRLSTCSQDQDTVWIHPVHGFIYQWKVLMLFLHRGLACKYSFRLGTEIREAEKFDDLVFEYVQNNKKVYRLLQAKHKSDETKKITAHKLLSEIKGDYSLIKYFYSFQACKEKKFFKDGIIKDVIICTNIDFDFQDLKRADIEIRKVQEKDDILDMKCDKKESTRYKFTNTMVEKLKTKLKGTALDDEIKDFINHLVFAVNQPNEEELGLIVQKEIGREMDFIDSKNACDKLLIKIMNLSMGKEKSMFLSHEEGKKFFDNLQNEITIWFNVQEPVSSFTGRLGYLIRIHEILTENFQMCITGMGGIGKTELVRQYIANYGHEYDNQVVWINAESYRSTVNSFHQLASDKLNISLINSDGKDKHITSIIADVYQVLSKRKSLIIFDNAEKYKSENEFDCGIDQFLPCLPNKSTKPSIIITSRNQKWPASTQAIVLETLSVVEARDLVEKTLTLENDEQKEMIDELGKKLQFLPLALQQAVAYIKMQKEKLACIELGFEISNYLERYSEMTHELLDFKFSEDSDSDYDKSVFATWNITLDILKKKENGQDALDILNIISFLLPDNIPIDLLLIFLTDQKKLSSAVNLLKQYSIINVQHKSLSIHRLVQQVTRIKLEQQSAQIAILQNSLKLFNKDDLNLKNLDHVISIRSFARKYSELLEEFSLLSTHIIVHLIDCGRIDEATSICYDVISLVEASPQSLMSYQDCLLSIKHSLASCILQKGEYEVALEKYQEVYEAQKIICDPESIPILVTRTSIANILIKLGRTEEAVRSYDEIVYAYRTNYGENNPYVLDIKSSISSFLSDQGQHEEALSIQQEIYRIHKETLGDGHVKTLTSRRNIAVLLGNLGQIEESWKIMKKVCSDREALLPKDHPDVLGSKFDMADGLAKQKKYNLALEIYQDLVALQTDKLGENHPEVIKINVHIGSLLKRQKKYDEALKIYKGVLAKKQITFALTPLEILRIRSDLADAFVRLKNYKEAYAVYKDLLYKQISFFGKSHPETMQTRRFMFMTLEDMKKYDAALACGLETLDLVEEIFGKNHPSTFADKNNVGFGYFHTRHFDKALVILTEILKAQESSLGKDHIDCQQTKNNIAVVFAERAKFYRDNSQKDNTDQSSKSSKYIISDINAKDAEGRTRLHHAVSNANEPEVERLLEHGAEVFVASNKGNTPLHIAVLKGQENLIKLLLQKLNRDRLNEFVDARTTSAGSTALHVAANMGHFGIVKYLLKSRATFCVTNKDGKMPVDLSNSTNITNFLKMVHELFRNVEEADATVVRKLMVLSSEDFLAIANTRNDGGLTLAQVAMLNKQNDVAAQILQMLQKCALK